MCCWSTVSGNFFQFFFVQNSVEKIILMSKMKNNAFPITIHRVDRLEFRDSGGGTVFATCVCVCVVMCGGGGTVVAMRVV
jgi:hypothetical protein